jgi:hypothetical protein
VLSFFLWNTPDQFGRSIYEIVVCYRSSIDSHIISMFRELQRAGDLLNYFENIYVSDVFCRHNIVCNPYERVLMYKNDG